MPSRWRWVGYGSPSTSADWSPPSSSGVTGSTSEGARTVQYGPTAIQPGVVTQCIHHRLPLARSDQRRTHFRPVAVGLRHSRGSDSTERWIWSFPARGGLYPGVTVRSLKVTGWQRRLSAGGSLAAFIPIERTPMSARSKPLALVLGVAITAMGLGVATSGSVAAAPSLADHLPRRFQRQRAAELRTIGYSPSGRPIPGGPANFGTGEIETMTNNPNNVDVRNGNLYITPQRDAAGAWTSARVETDRANFKPPAGGIMHVESRLQMPNVTGAEALGYWPAFWMLGEPLSAGPVVVAGYRRVRHHGERPGPELDLQRAALRHLGRHRATSRRASTTATRTTPARRAWSPPARPDSTPTASSGTAPGRPTSCAGTSTAR